VPSVRLVASTERRAPVLTAVPHFSALQQRSLWGYWMYGYVSELAAGGLPGVPVSWALAGLLR